MTETAIKAPADLSALRNTQLPLMKHREAIAWERRIAASTYRTLRSQSNEAARRADRGLEALPPDWRTRWEEQFYNTYRSSVYRMTGRGWQLAGAELDPDKRTERKRVSEVIVGAEDPAADMSFLLDGDHQAVEDYLERTARAGAQNHAAAIDREFQKASSYYDPKLGRGYTTAEIAKAIRTGTTAHDKWYANLIARTTATWSYNEGAMQRYAASEIEKIEWFTTQDDATCEFCAQMDREIVEIRQPFLATDTTFEGVEGGQMIVPTRVGNVEHPPLHPHCRCTLLPVVEFVDQPVTAEEPIEEPIEEPQLSEDATAALNRYVVDYEDLNQGLREGKLTPELRKYRDSLDEAIEQSQALTEKKTFYRGMELDDDHPLLDSMKKGMTFSDDAFVSVSAKKEVAENFALGGGFGDKQVLMKIEVPKGAKMARVPSGLDELLLPRSKGPQYFKVTNVTRSGSKIMVEAKWVSL